MNKMLAVVVGFMFLGLVGCASTGTPVNNANTANADNTANGTSVKKIEKNVIERIPATTPDWVTKGIPYEEKNDKFYYVTSVNEYEDLDVAKKVATAEAQATIAKEIKQTINTRFSEASAGTSKNQKLGIALKDRFSSNVENLEVRGIVTAGIYSEQIQEIQGNESKVYWRTYVLSTIPKPVYNELVKKAFDNTKAQILPQDNIAMNDLKEFEQELYKSN